MTSMSSVLLSLCLSMFAVAQALTSFIHDCIEWSSSDILSGGADICNCRSSASEWCMIECESMMADKGLIYKVKSIEPRTEPWGTPVCTGAKVEQWLDKETLCVRSIRWHRNHWRTVSVNPKSVWRRCTMIEWSIVSNAEEKSCKASTDKLPLLRERNRSLTTFRRTVSVLWPGQYADWQVL